MDFCLQQVIPEPLRGQHRADSQIWACETVLKQGQRIFVSAASGKGKTTLQHMLYGLRKDYTGKVSLGAKDLAEAGLEDWAVWRAEHLAIVFQDLRLFAHLTAWDNLLLKQQLRPQVSQEQLKDWAAYLGVLDLLQKPLGLLSYGQKQRFALIRALAQPFSWLLMDEPFAHLDQANINLCSELIQRVCLERGAGWILASLGEDYGLTYDVKLAL